MNNRNIRWMASVIAGVFVMHLGGPAFAQTAAPAPAPAPAAEATAKAAPAAEKTAPAEAKAAPAAAATAGAAPAEPRLGLLIFPLESQVEQQGNTLGPLVAKGLKDATLRSSAYVGISFNPRHPIMKRAVDESLVKEADLAGPFGVEAEQVTKAVALGRLMEAPRVLVGSIQDFEFNSEKREGQVTITAEIVNTDTGRVDGKVMVATGKSPATMVTGSPEQFALAAAQDAVQQLSSKFPGVVIPTADSGQAKPTEKPAKKKSNGGLIAAAALAVGLIIAASGGGGGGGSSTPADNPPAPPY